MERKYDITKEQISSLLADGDDPLLDVDETAEVEAALISFAEAHSMPPPLPLKEMLLGKLKMLQEQKEKPVSHDLNELPFLSPTSNWQRWAATIEHIQPPTELDNIHLHTIASDDKRELFVAWVREKVDEEVHYDLVENILLLEGSCKCHITDKEGETKIVKLTQGDFISMKIGETHDIIITSKQPAKAILEWRKIAA